MSAVTLSPTPAIVAPPLQPAIAPSGMGAVTAQWLSAEDWPSVRDDWQALFEAAAPNVFLAPAFALAARAIDPAPGLGAVVVMRDGRWVGFVPGRIGLRGSMFSAWTHDYAPYGLPLVRPGDEAAVLSALFSVLRDRRVAALDWPMLDEGPFAAALAAFCAGRRIAVLDRHDRACLVEAPPKPSKDHRRLARRLADHGALDQVSTATGHPFDEAMDAFLALEAAGWKGRKGTALAGSAATRGFCVAGISGLASAGMARIDLMRLDGRPIAAGVSLAAGDRAWYWKTAYSEELARYSPGLLLSHAIGESLMAGGISLADSCAIPGHSMIERIWPGRMAMTRRLIAVRPGAPGWRFYAVLAAMRALIDGKALAKRLLKR
jgi:CelD/BcsL family acetyltransferase involved in cellulose biosynthesis